MAKQYNLYTDELGEYSPERYKKSPLFIIAGCIVEIDDVLRVKHLLDLVKYKYWEERKGFCHIQKKHCPIQRIYGRSLHDYF